jgi:hypothetical protein
MEKNILLKIRAWAIYSGGLSIRRMSGARNHSTAEGQNVIHTGKQDKHAMQVGGGVYAN